MEKQNIIYNQYTGREKVMLQYKRFCLVIFHNKEVNYLTSRN